MRSRRLFIPVAAALIAASSGTAQAATGIARLDLVNSTGHAIASLFIRRTGTQGWMTLPATPARLPGGARAKTDFTDPDCAFDIRATLDDQQDVVWVGLNLCEVKSVTLHISASGVTWADYD